MFWLRVSAINVIGMTLMTLGFITGASLNGYILKVSSEKWKMGLSVSSTELTYLFMGLVNICLQTMTLVQMVLFSFFPRLYFEKGVYFAISIPVSGLIFYSFWLTAWLCVNFCISIANFNHRVFAWLQRILSSYLLHCITMSAVVPLVTVLLSIWCLKVGIEEQSLGNSTSQSTLLTILYSQSPAYRVLFVLGGCPPFIIAFISTGATTFSMLRHIKNMKKNLPGISSPSLQALTNATKTMVTFLTLSLCFYILQLYIFSGTELGDISANICWDIMMSYPSAEALVIILASPKMKKGILEKLCLRKSLDRISKA